MRLEVKPGTEPVVGSSVCAFTSYDGANRERMLAQWFRVVDHLWPGMLALHPIEGTAFWIQWNPEQNAPARPIEAEPYDEPSLIDVYRSKQNGQ